MLEVVSTVLEEVIETRFKTLIQFHDVLHEFRGGRGGRDHNNGSKTCPWVGKFGTRPPIPDITWSKEVIWQPGMCTANINNGGVQGRTKTAGLNGEIFVMPGGSHYAERIPYPTIPSNQRDNTGDTGLSYTLQCGSLHRGSTLDLTYSGGWARHSQLARDEGGKEYGHVLCGCRPHLITGPRVDPRGHQYPYHNLL